MWNISDDFEACDIIVGKLKCPPCAPIQVVSADDDP